MARTGSFVILVCDDDEDDRLLIGEALEEVGLSGEARFVSDGVELMDYLKQSEDETNPDAPPRPDLILLDLNMPRMGGREALRAIKSHLNYRAIPVVILTTSEEEEDIARCYRAGANSFISKPMSFGGLVQALQCFGLYWTGVVKLPPRCKGFGTG